MYGFKNREVIPLLALHCIIPLVLCVIILHQSSQDYTDERVQPQLDYTDPVIFLLSFPELSLIYQTILYFVAVHYVDVDQARRYQAKVKRGE